MNIDSQLEIREVQGESFSEIWPIFKEVIQDADSYPYLPETDFDQALAYWFAKDAKVYCAYLDGKVVASRYIVPNKAGLGSHVANTGVIIDKAFRGQGLGRKMMAFAIEEAQRLGYRAIQLNLVAETNLAS